MAEEVTQDNEADPWKDRLSKFFDPSQSAAADAEKASAEEEDASSEDETDSDEVDGDSGVTDTENEDESSDQEEDTQEEDEEESSEDKDSDEEVDKKKRKKSARERIAELTKARRQAEREANALKAELDALKADIEAIKKGVLKTTEEGDKVEDKLEPPSPEDFEFGEVDPKYIQAKVDFEVKRALLEQRKVEEEEKKRQEQAAHKEKLAQLVEERIAKGVAEFPDFQEVVLEGDNIPISDEASLAIIMHDEGHKIAYHLATHQEEVERISKLPAVLQVLEIGRIAARLSPPKGASSQKKVSKAPKPVERARGAGGKFAPGPDTEDFSAFKAWAMQRMRGK